MVLTVTSLNFKCDWFQSPISHMPETRLRWERFKKSLEYWNIPNPSPQPCSSPSKTSLDCDWTQISDSYCRLWEIIMASCADTDFLFQIKCVPPNLPFFCHNFHQRFEIFWYLPPSSYHQQTDYSIAHQLLLHSSYLPFCCVSIIPVSFSGFSCVPCSWFYKDCSIRYIKLI